VSSNLSSLHVLNNYISVKSAAYLTGYSPQYLRRMLRIGWLIGVKIGQVWLSDKRSLDAHLLLRQQGDSWYGPR
jgi:hypothetical protein